MRSIHSKFLAVILSCVLAAAILNSVLGIAATTRVLEHSSTEIMNHSCNENAANLNGLFVRIEQAVDSLAIYVTDVLESPELLMDEGYRENFLSTIFQVGISTASATDGCIGVYLRLSPELTDDACGLFWMRENDESPFHQVPCTPISQYSASDTSHVGWWYSVVEKGEPVWMEPYYNDISDVQIISYVVPLYKNGVFVGVVGMDISFDLIEQATGAITAYKTGYAALINSKGKVMYHPGYPFGCDFSTLDPTLSAAAGIIQSGQHSREIIPFKLNGEKKIMAYAPLLNGMSLLSIVPEREIHADRNELVRSNIFVTLIVTAAAFVLASLLVRGLMRSLKRLGEVAQSMLSEDDAVKALDTRPDNDEVGQITASFLDAQKQIHQRMVKLNEAAIQDGLTGVKNKAAFNESCQIINERIPGGDVQFALAVFDVNYLKHANDVFGHRAGDALLKCVSGHISSVFANSSIYRIGGDEFVAILRGEDLPLHQSLYSRFQESVRWLRLEEYPEVRISCAIGLSVFDPMTDKSVSEVFERADQLMYQNKREIKAADQQSSEK